MRSSMSGSPSNATARDIRCCRTAIPGACILRFVAGRRRRSVSALTLADLNADEVLAFLKHVESERRASIGTRNCRLAAIRSFHRFVADREPLAAMQCAAVLRIPMKKGPEMDPSIWIAKRSTAISPPTGPLDA